MILLVDEMSTEEKKRGQVPWEILIELWDKVGKGNNRITYTK